MEKKKRKLRKKLDPESRKSQILEKAIKIFSKQGYQNTDIQTIADKIGVAKGTVYLYFKSKKELFLSAVEFAIVKLAERIDSEVKKEKHPIQKITAVIRAYFCFFDEENHLSEIIVKERSEFMRDAQNTYFRVFSENAHHLEEIIQSGINLGAFRETDPKLTTQIFADVLYGTIYTYFMTDKKKDVIESIESVTDFLLFGLMKRK